MTTCLIVLNKCVAPDGHHYTCLSFHIDVTFDTFEFTFCLPSFSYSLLILCGISINTRKYYGLGLISSIEQGLLWIIHLHYLVCVSSLFLLFFPKPNWFWRFAELVCQDSNRTRHQYLRNNTWPIVCWNERDDGSRGRGRLPSDKNNERSQWFLSWCLFMREMPLWCPHFECCEFWMVSIVEWLLLIYSN